MSLAPKSVFITGCSRGLGLEFVKQLLSLPSPPKHVFATCRNVEKAQDLTELAKKNSSVHVKAFDVLDHSSYPSIISWVEETVGNEGLNLLINNAATFDTSPLPEVTKDKMAASFESNTISPLLIAQAFVPLLKKAATSGGGENILTCSHAAIINITSRMGSLGDNTSGGNYPYRASKAALNMVTKSLAVDLKKDGILTMVLHPGWVQTDMGGKKALINKETSVAKMLSVMASLTETDTGTFRSFDSSTIPW